MIQLNKVGVEIDDKVYQFYKMNFGVRRKLVEIQNEMSRLKNEALKNDGVDITDMSEEEAMDKLSEEVRSDLLKLDTDAKTLFKELLVDPNDAGIIDMLQTDDHINQLAQSLV